MAVIGIGAVHQNEIRERIDQLEAVFPDDIAAIDYRIGEDSTGDPSLFLTVHLTPRGNAAERLAQFVEQFLNEMRLKIGSEELGLHSYFDLVNP
jgi:hypothetical protein